MTRSKAARRLFAFVIVLIGLAASVYFLYVCMTQKSLEVGVIGLIGIFSTMRVLDKLSRELPWDD